VRTDPPGAAPLTDALGGVIYFDQWRRWARSECVRNARQLQWPTPLLDQPRFI
jgi:hypothetical protein